MDRETFLRIAKPQATCVLCGAPLAEAGKHPSVLVAPEAAQNGESDDIPRREDYCPRCWEDRASKNYVGFWITKREPPQPRKVQNRRERNARLAAYFDYFYHEDRVAHAPRLFFLAHLLMRYGVFRWLRTEVDEETGRERIYYRHLVNDEDVAIESAELSDEELVAIKREIDELLAGTLWKSDEPQSGSDKTDQDKAAASTDDQPQD